MKESSFWQEKSQAIEAEKRFTFVEHLEDLRRRIIKSFAFFIIAAILVYSKAPSLLSFFTKPAGNLVFIYPTEAFIANLWITIIFGFMFASPVMIYQLWRFISSGLKKKEKKYAGIFGFFSFILFLAGCAFGYFLLFPVGLKFLLGFATETIIPMLTVSKYISFLGMFTLVFGLVFQLPLIILFLTKIGVVGPAMLSRRRREMIVGLFIVAALLTPPDIVTQVCLALPLFILYEVSILLSRCVYKPVA